jgi:hypothetical protein
MILVRKFIFKDLHMLLAMIAKRQIDLRYSRTFRIYHIEFIFFK